MADPAVARLSAAYKAVEKYSKRGLHPEEFLTFDFLKDHPILLQPGILRVDWNRIPGLTRRVDTLPTVVVPDYLWERWVGDWRDSWEPDEEPGHYERNVALVVCRSRFNDNPDTKGRDKRVNSLAIAHVPDTIQLSTFAEADALLKKTEENLNSVICLTRLHKAAKYYPDYFCNRKGRQLTLQHMQDRGSAGGAAANFAGGELLTTYTASHKVETYSKLPPGYRQGGLSDLINTGGRGYKVWGTGRDKKRPDIHDIPLASIPMMNRMPEHGVFPQVIIDMEPFRQWPKNRWPKEVAWIIPAREDPPKQTTGSPAHNASDGPDHDSGRSSPESSRAASPACSVCSAADSVARDLALSSSSRSGSSSDTPPLSERSSDEEDEQASNNDQAGHSGGEEGRSGDEGDPDHPPDRQADNTGGADAQESEDSSSDSDDDESSDDGRGTSEGAQHLEEVYSRVLKALHKTAQIMCAGYVKASGEIQPIIDEAVREAVQPNKIYIRSTSGHLSEWGHALHNMLNSDGASAEEREEASRAARLAGLKCVRSLLADGQAFNAAEEQDIEKRLHDTIQAALKVANDRADKTLQKVNKRVPKIIRKYVPDGQAGTFLASVHRSMGEHYLSVHGMVMSQVVIPFHVARGTYFTSGNMFRAINNVVPGLSAAATGFQSAPQALPAVPAEACRSAPPPHKESLETPSKDTSTGHSGKQGSDQANTSGQGGDRSSSKKSSGGAPLMQQSRRDFKTKERKMQTGGTPGSKRSSSGKKLDSAAIDRTWSGFERDDDAHKAARRVLEMNPQSGGAILSTSDHELSVEILSARDAPRKRKGDSSSEDDGEHPVVESSRRKKRKKTTQPEGPDMFDSDYKGNLSFSRSGTAKPVPCSKPDSSSKPDKASKQPDDDSGLGSSLGPSQKSKKAKKQKGSGKPDPLDDELQKRKERQEKAIRDQRATQALLVEFRPQQYALEAETMKNYRSQNVNPRQAACENFDDHSSYIQHVLDNNKQSFICQSFHLFSVDAFFRRVRYKISQATGSEKDRLQEVFNSAQTTVAKKLPGCKGRASDSYLAKYVIRVLKASDGTILDASHLEFGGEHNLGLHGLVSHIATARITRNKKKHFYDGWGEGHIEHGFCPLCSYASGSHKAISNHIRAHLRLAMYCGWCYYLSLSTEDMLKHGKEHEIIRTRKLIPDKK